MATTLKPQLFKLPPGSIRQLDAIASKPAYGSKTAVVRRAIQQLFDSEFPAVAALNAGRKNANIS